VEAARRGVRTLPGGLRVHHDRRRSTERLLQHVGVGAADREERVGGPDPGALSAPQQPAPGTGQAGEAPALDVHIPTVVDDPPPTSPSEGEGERQRHQALRLPDVGTRHVVPDGLGPASREQDEADALEGAPDGLAHHLRRAEHRGRRVGRQRRSQDPPGGRRLGDAKDREAVPLLSLREGVAMPGHDRDPVSGRRQRRGQLPRPRVGEERVVEQQDDARGRLDCPAGPDHDAVSARRP